MKLFLKKDIIIILSLLTVALVLFAFFSSDNQGLFYEISVDSGERIRESIYTKKTTVLECGVVIICDGKSVFFEESDCPDRVCVGMGRLSLDGEWAACLPNSVFLKVSGGDES